MFFFYRNKNHDNFGKILHSFLKTKKTPRKIWFLARDLPDQIWGTKKHTLAHDTAAVEAGDVVCAGDATVEGQGIVGGEVALGQGHLDVPGRKLGSMVRISGLFHLLIDEVYWGYNPLTNHLLTFWDIQAGFFYDQKLGHGEPPSNGICALILNTGLKISAPFWDLITCVCLVGWLFYGFWHHGIQ